MKLMRRRATAALGLLLALVSCTAHPASRAHGRPPAVRHNGIALVRFNGITFATPPTWRVHWTVPGCQRGPENDSVRVVSGEVRYLGSCLLARLIPANLTTVVITSYFAPLSGRLTRWHGASAGLFVGEATRNQPATASLQLPDQNAQVMIYAPSASAARSLLDRVGIAEPR